MHHPDDPHGAAVTEPASAAADAPYAAIARELETLTEFVYQLPVGVVRCAADGSVELMNPPVAQLLPGEMNAWTTGNVFDLLENVFPDLRSLVSGHDRTGRIVAARRLPIAAPVPGRAMVWLQVDVIRFEDGGFAMTMADVSPEVEREQQLRQASAWVAALVQGRSAHMACRLDADGTITDWTPAAERMTGYTAEDVVGRSAETLFAAEPQLRERLDSRLRRASVSGWDLDEGMMRRAQGSGWFANSLITALDDTSDDARYALVARDMTDQREATEALRRMTVQDALTGAYNRAYLFTVGALEMTAARAVRKPVSAIVLDIDWFKQVNDTYGHKAGDAALRSVSLLCQKRLRGTDLLARLGGEEFCALLPGCNLETARRIAEQMRRAIEAEPLSVDGREIPMTASLGVASIDDETESLQDLIAAADRAMYVAKREGRNRVRTVLDATSAAETSVG